MPHQPTSGSRRRILPDTRRIASCLTQAHQNWEDTTRGWALRATPAWLVRVGHLDSNGGPLGVSAWHRVSPVHIDICSRGPVDERWLAYILGFAQGWADAGDLTTAEHVRLRQVLCARVAHSEPRRSAAAPERTSTNG